MTWKVYLSDPLRLIRPTKLVPNQVARYKRHGWG